MQKGESWGTVWGGLGRRERCAAKPADGLQPEQEGPAQPRGEVESYPVGRTTRSPEVFRDKRAARPNLYFGTRSVGGGGRGGQGRPEDQAEAAQSRRAQPVLHRGGLSSPMLEGRPSIHPSGRPESSP